MKRKTIFIFTPLLVPLVGFSSCTAKKEVKPNILFVVADDQSYPDASAYGSTMVSTPAFDLVAKKGVLFTNAYVTSPGSSPSRASILTGLYPWQLEEAGTHASSFSTKYTCFPDLLKNSGYLIGYTGKGWGPGDWKVSGRSYNPAGPEYNDAKLTPPYDGISRIDYASNFKKFLSGRKKGQPFYFWFGAQEPHRPYELDSWKKEGWEINKVETRRFMPESDIIKGDLLDYAVELEWYDNQLMQCIEELKRIGEFDNTIIIVTADNGMSFPRAKANCYDAGVHVPLAISWGKKIKPGQIVETLVSAVDFAPTILSAAGLEIKSELVGENLIPLLTNNNGNHIDKEIYSGRERHSNSRYDNLGYPMRSVRWKNYLLIRNFHPERWPAGDPKEKTDKKKDNEWRGFYDIDNAPSKTYIIENRENESVKPYFESSMGKRGEYELFDLRNDPECLVNLVGNSTYADIFDDLKIKLAQKMAVTGDTRVGSNPEIWETYPRLEGKMREFPPQ